MKPPIVLCAVLFTSCSGSSTGPVSDETADVQGKITLDDVPLVTDLYLGVTILPDAYVFIASARSGPDGSYHLHGTHPACATDDREVIVYIERPYLHSESTTCGYTTLDLELASKDASPAPAVTE